MITADRTLVRIALPPLLGIGLAVVLMHPLEPVTSDDTPPLPGAVSPQPTEAEVR